MEPHKEQPSESRVKQFKESTRAEYDRYSVVRRIVDWRTAIDDRDVTFVQIGQRFHIPPGVLLDSYSKGDNVVVPNIIGLGHSIAIGEEKYLVKQLKEFISNRDHIDNVSFDTISKSLDYYKMSNPRSVLIPLGFYSALHVGKIERMHVGYKNYDPYLNLDSERIPIYWSNNYVPFDEFIFIGTELSQWVVKPDETTGHSLIIEVGELKGEKIEVIVKTVAGFSEKDPRAGLMLGVPATKKAEDFHD